jgi:purine-nucleoside phosphorylase
VSANILEAVVFIQERIEIKPEVAMILGSGLGFLADEIDEAVSIPYQEIPHFPLSTIVGHEGSLVIGTFQGVPCVCMKGRVHCYEGYPMQKLVLPMYVMHELGAQTLIVTNAAGGVNPTFRVGDLMMISDHINFLGDNPLRGPNREHFGPRFPDMSFTYSPTLRDIWRTLAQKNQVRIQEGVYAAMMGPSYETPAEVQMLHRLGADAVGMSTVPEVIVASHCSMQVTGLSVITNAAAGLGTEPLSHEEVKDASQKVQVHVAQLLREFMQHLAQA